MRIFERGRFALDRPIGGLLPDDVRELLERRYDLGEITTRMLLQHTSGIASHDTAGPDGTTSPFLAAVGRDPAYRWTALEQIKFSVDHFAPAHEPGGAMLYTDTGYIVLGQLLEHVTGTSLPTAVRQLCRLDELGLANTWWERLEPTPDPEPPRAGFSSATRLGTRRLLDRSLRRRRARVDGHRPHHLVARAVPRRDHRAPAPSQ